MVSLGSHAGRSAAVVTGWGQRHSRGEQLLARAPRARNQALPRHFPIGQAVMRGWKAAAGAS